MTGGGLEFRLLGPFEVRVGGKPVEVASPKHRVLLATLLLNMGRTVPTSQLTEAVWGEALPEHPRRAVQVLVTRLRALLAGLAGEHVIATHPDGYSIAIAPDHADLGQFQHWLREARRAGDQGDSGKEAAALAEALAQWHGEPLAGVPSPLLRREVAPRLQEQRLQALERRIQLDLEAGRYPPLIAELSGLTSQFPLRERFWAQLMTALHGSGRRSEALDAYHRLRQRLVEELGVDPGDELRRLHATILTGRAGDGRAAEFPPVPRQLPPDLPGFVGRAEVVAQLDALLDGQTSGIVLIVGTAGVGKTVLATHWARRVADRFPDGQLWVNLRGHHHGQSVPPEQAMARFLRALGVPGDRIPPEPAEQAALYRSTMDGRRMLVVLDNADSADQVRPLLPGGYGSLVVVTSRSQLSGLVAAEQARPLAIDLFTVDEARQLLARRLGPEPVAAHPRAVEEIVQRCARLPLALAVVAARAAGRPGLGLDALAAELREADGDLDAFATGEPGTDVRTVFSWSYRALTPPAARLFRLLGVHHGQDLAAPAAASLAGLPVQRVRPLLSELVRANLLAESGTGRYAFHDLLRAYAVELVQAVETDADRREAERRLLDHYLHTAYRAANLQNRHRSRIELDPPATGVTPEDLDDDEDALAWFAAEHPVLLAVLDHATSAGLDTHGWQLSWTLLTFLDRQGHWADLVAVQQAGVAAAQRSGDSRAEAHAHRYLASAYLRLRRYEDADAHLHRSLDLHERVGDHSGKAHTHRLLSAVLGRQRRHREALWNARRALDLFQVADDQRGAAWALNSTGWHHAMLGEHGPALSACQRALALAQQIHDRELEAHTLDSIGYAQHQLGHAGRAIASYRRAIDLLRELGDRFNLGLSLNRIGDAYQAAGEADAAREAWRRALDILSDLDHPDAAQVRGKLDARPTA